MNAATLFLLFGVFLLLDAALPALPVAVVALLAIAIVAAFAAILRALPARLRPAVMRTPQATPAAGPWSVTTH